MDNNYKISHDTERVEELWTELSQAWPAVKNNPEIAEKIEKLWSILKDSGNDHLSISKEIESLLYSDNPTPVSKETSSFSTLDTKATSYTKPDEIIAGSQISATQADEDLDSLLAEILGENYQAETSQPVIQTDNESGIAESKSVSSGTEELDKLVADILGEDWLKEDSSTISSPATSYDSKTAEIVSSSDSSQTIFESDNSIDNLVSSIIADEINKETITPFAPTEQPEVQQDSEDKEDKEDIDSLLNKIISEESLSDEIINNSIKPVENIDELISDILSNESVLSDVTSDLMSNDTKEEIITNENPEEDIDKLINEILASDNKSSIAANDFSNTSDNENISTENNFEDILKNNTSEVYVASNLESNESSEENINDIINDVLKDETDAVHIPSNMMSSENVEENIDDIINDVLKDETDEIHITSNIANSENAEENIDDLISEILEDKTDKKIIENDDTNIEEIQVHANKGTLAYQSGDSQIFSDALATDKPKKVEPTVYKQPEKQSSNTLIIIILIILMMLFIGVWKFIFNKEEMTQVTTTEKQQIEIIDYTEEDSAIIEEPPAEEYTPTTTNEYQYKAETDNNLPTMEQSTIQQDYSAQFEKDNDDITITLNTPETAIESNTDSAIFNENETITTVEIEPLASDNINNIETITEKTAPTDTLGKDELIAEKVKKEKPVKIIAKRRVIIHKIVKGDTLWAIAKRYINNPYRYPELAKLSKIKNPNRIYPGNKVRIIIYTK